jgi:adenylate cyclase
MAPTFSSIKLKIPRRWLIQMLIIALAATGLFLALQRWDPPPLQVLRMKQLDLFQNLKPREKKKFPVVIVNIDDQSLTALGQWPWPRTQLAQLVQILMADGAAVVGFDIIFAEEDRLSPNMIARDLKGVDNTFLNMLKNLPSNDQVFARTIKKSRVVLGQALIADNLPDTISKEARKTGLAAKGGDPKPYIYRLGGLVRNIPVLEKSASGIGATTIIPEFDQIVRRIPLLWRAGDQLYPSLGVEMLRVATGQRAIVTKVNKYGLESVVVAGVEIPTDENGMSWIRYNDPDPARYVSIKDVFSGAFSPGRFRGHLVLVGASAAGFHDVKETPVHHAMPGVEVHAQWLETVLSKSFLKRPNYILGAEYLLTAAFCIVLALALPLLGPLAGFVIGVTGMGGVGYASWYLFAEKGVLLGVTYPILAGFLLYQTLVLMNYFRSEAHRREVRQAFSHYLAPELVSEISADPSKLKLSGEVRELTFLFTDLANFTSLVEKSDPDMVVNLLNEYLDGTCKIVMDHGGTIDKIVGDAIHVMFGAPSKMEDHAARAVVCALELDAFCKEFEKRKNAEGIPFGITRTGINTGQVVVGNFGGASRFDYTAHGDAINSAARMESVNKHLGTRMCVAGSTASMSPDVRFRPVASLVLKGKSVGIEAFEPITEEEWNSPRVKDYIAAFELIKREDPGMTAAFEDLSRKYPDDPLVKFQLKRFSAGETGVTAVMTEK